MFGGRNQFAIPKTIYTISAPIPIPISTDVKINERTNMTNLLTQYDFN